MTWSINPLLLSLEALNIANYQHIVFWLGVKPSSASGCLSMINLFPGLCVGNFKQPVGLVLRPKSPFAKKGMWIPIFFAFFGPTWQCWTNGHGWRIGLTTLIWKKITAISNQHQWSLPINIHRQAIWHDSFKNQIGSSSANISQCTHKMVQDHNRWANWCKLCRWLLRCLIVRTRTTADCTALEWPQMSRPLIVGPRSHAQKGGSCRGLPRRDTSGLAMESSCCPSSGVRGPRT